ncbi:hypothetical protein [Robiginitalea biformata]|uniref:Uncharacterized protein n=1 Tax=Robiginitalea biformata (strain ATCC BAA-864 / DSM 15991 / KCTC 12146 / HTCC2501) TaxID=313596 RepID=A4CME7_ROBBH|nr:hypothetical protein [Robiginitalea biformata]EAR14839.1 hypothetical protein RB2501_10952 [Robiginitalea biformata HTCC2501]
MKKIATISSAFILGLANYLNAQFTQAELFSGFDKTDFTLYASYPVNEKETLSSATLAFFQKFNDEENEVFDEVGVQPTVFWNLNKRVSIGPSLYYNSISGFAQRLTAKFTVKTPRLLVVVLPTVGHYQRTKRGYAETFAQIQFNTPVSGKVSLWINGQFLTVWDNLKRHSRSFQQLRGGVSIKGHQFGIGYDLDQYGPSPVEKHSFGVYYRTIL